MRNLGSAIKSIATRITSSLTVAASAAINWAPSYGAIGTPAGDKLILYPGSSSVRNSSIGVDAGTMYFNTNATCVYKWACMGTQTMLLNDTGGLTVADLTVTGGITVPGLPVYKEYRTYMNEFGSGYAYIYPLLAVTANTDYKKLLKSTCTFVAKSGYARVTINGNVWPSTGGTATVGIFLALGTNSAGTTFIYPVGLGSGTGGPTQHGSVMYGDGQVTWDGMYAVTAGTTYWPVVRFVPYFTGTVNVQASLCTIEHIVSLT
jgi:hypothetical protein